MAKEKYEEKITVEIDFDDVWEFMCDCGYSLKEPFGAYNTLVEYADSTFPSLYYILDDYPNFKDRVITAFENYLSDKQQKAFEEQRDEEREAFTNDLQSLISRIEFSGFSFNEILEKVDVEL